MHSLVPALLRLSPGALRARTTPTLYATTTTTTTTVTTSEFCARSRSRNRSRSSNSSDRLSCSYQLGRRSYCSAKEAEIAATRESGFVGKPEGAEALRVRLQSPYTCYTTWHEVLTAFMESLPATGPKGKPLPGYKWRIWTPKSSHAYTQRTAEDEEDSNKSASHKEKLYPWYSQQHFPLDMSVVECVRLERQNFRVKQRTRCAVTIAWREQRAYFIEFPKGFNDSPVDSLPYETVYHPVHIPYEWLIAFKSVEWPALPSDFDPRFYIYPKKWERAVTDPIEILSKGIARKAQHNHPLWTKMLKIYQEIRVIPDLAVRKELYEELQQLKEEYGPVYHHKKDYFGERSSGDTKKSSE